MKYLPVLALALGLSVDMPASAGCTNPGVNLLANCGFASGVAGWTPEGGGSALFVHDGVQGHSIAGSSHVSGDNSVGASQCFAVPPGLYGFGMHGNNFSTSGVLMCTLTVQGFSTLGCVSGSEVGSPLTQAAGLTNGLGWVTMNNTGTLLATVQAARFRIGCLAPGVTLADAFLDDIFFGTGLTPAELLDFSID